MSKNGTSYPELFFKELMAKSVSKNREEAIKEWEVIIYFDNCKSKIIRNEEGEIIDIDIDEVGHYFQNKCNHKPTDECKHLVTRREEISKKTGKPMLPVMCRWVNYHNLNLAENLRTNYSCICGEPIIWVFHIKNKINGKSIPETKSECGIGSNCIKKFLDCDEQLENAKINKLLDIRPNKFCPVCKNKNRRKNLLPNEFKSCLECPPLCEIMDCKNIAFEGSQLCKNHLGNFNLNDTVTLMPIDELPPAPKNILHYTRRSKAKVLKVSNKDDYRNYFFG